MKKLAAALLVLATVSSAAAQEVRPKIGLGVAIVPLGGPSINTIEVYAPILISPQFRLEPSLGILSNNGPSGGRDTRDITIGVGGFLVNRVAPTVDMYAGGRLKLNFAHVSDPAGSDSGTDIVIAAAVGGEYYLVPRFSIGLEGQLGLYSNSDLSGDNGGIFTNGLAFLRVYFK